MFLPQVLGPLERRQLKAAVSGEILGTLSQDDPSVYVLHVATFRLSFIRLRYIPHIPLE